MKITKSFFNISILCLAAAFTLYAQKDDKKKESVEVRLNLTVKNAAEAPLNDLKKEDVKIFEDGDEQKIDYFSTRDTKINLGLVVDNTGSMRSRFPFVINIAKQVIGGLGEKDEAFLARFVSTDKIALLQDWTSDKTALIRRGAEQMYVEGGQSAVIDGLDFAADIMLKRAKDNSSEHYALVLISDCEDRASILKEDQLFAKLEGSGIQIFVIALTGELGRSAGFISAPPKDRAERLANRLALKTGGGAYLQTDKKTSVEAIEEMLKPLMAELHSQYVIGYRSSNTKRNDKQRKLRIEIAPGEKGEVRPGFIRESYVVPGDEEKPRR